jgi:hypothetical protein
VAIFGRKTVRQRLRTATRESLTIPTFGSAVDCTPWVTGGLWPAALSTPTAETRGLIDYLKSDLQRITRRANDELTTIKRANLTESARRAHESRVIAEARAHATRRIESTLRQQQRLPAAQYRPRNGAHVVADPDKTRVMPVITDLQPASDTSGESVRQRPSGPPTAGPDTTEAQGGRHRAHDVDNSVGTTRAACDGLDPPDSVGRR